MSDDTRNSKSKLETRNSKLGTLSMKRKLRNPEFGTRNLLPGLRSSLKSLRPSTGLNHRFLKLKVCQIQSQSPQ